MSKEGVILVEFEHYDPLFESEDELQHYGVLGMKWGVRKDPSKAYGKAVKKRNKLQQKAVDTNFKSAKLRKKAFKKQSRATSEKQAEKARKLEYKANKYALKSAKLQKKGQKWVKAMDKTFRGYKIQSLPDGSYRVTGVDDED